MNVYSLLRLANNFKHPRIKLFGIYLLHTFRRRYIGLFFDPVLACNLRYKMCHFSDDEHRRKMRGSLTLDQMKMFGDAFFHRALKLQIGCGAEPLVHKDLPALIALAKEKKVPWISVTTNANLMTEDLLMKCLESGLNEITISMHGVKKETYEYFMDNAKYEKFVEVLRLMTKAKEKYKYTIRVNYTINEDNVDELEDFFDVFGDIGFDIIQLRPIANFGDTTYHNFSHDRIIEKYDNTIQKVKDEANRRNIMCIAPLKEQLVVSDNKNDNSIVFDGLYYSITPELPWRGDFELGKETFESYSKRKKLGKRLFKSIFQKSNNMNRKKRQLNYTID